MWGFSIGCSPGGREILVLQGDHYRATGGDFLDEGHTVSKFMTQKHPGLRA